MIKIISAMNAMINQSNLISEVTVFETEYFFKFKDKFIWGILNNHEGEYFLYYYPQVQSTTQALDKYTDMNNDFSNEFVIYRSKDYNAKEEKQTFAALYALIKEKIFNLDVVLDEIISGDKT